MNVCVAQCRPPRDLDSKATIKIDDKTFEVEANDLQYMCTLGRGAYGVVEKVRHRLTDTIMAVKVHHHWHIFFGMGDIGSVVSLMKIQVLRSNAV